MTETLTSWNIKLSSWISLYHIEAFIVNESIRDYLVLSAPFRCLNVRKKPFKQVTCLAAQGISVSVFK
jgi:hypothetical protein